MNPPQFLNDPEKRSRFFYDLRTFTFVFIIILLTAQISVKAGKYNGAIEVCNQLDMWAVKNITNDKLQCWKPLYVGSNYKKNLSPEFDEEMLKSLNITISKND